MAKGTNPVIVKQIVAQNTVKQVLTIVLWISQAEVGYTE